MIKFCWVLGLTLSLLTDRSLIGQEQNFDLGEAALLDLRDRKTFDDDEFDQLGLRMGDRFLYDAQTIGFDKDGKRYIFQGDVVLIGGASIITADTIEIDYSKKELQARGHVIMLSRNQVFTGTKITMYWETSDFIIDDSVMVVNDGARAKQVIEQVLGVSPEESDFVAAKAQYLTSIESDKLELRQRVIETIQDEDDLSQEIVDDYALLLERQILAQANMNPSLAKKGEKKRRSYLKRRKYWEESRENEEGRELPQKYYLKITGRTIERKNDNDYFADDAIVTPCKCEDDETPAWGFRADHIEAQEEGYVDLYHPVLTIKGVPLLYIPFLKVPFKTQRQSGFLMPGFQTGDQKNGFVYTQPVYFNLGDDKDSTVTFDLYQKRGTRLGVEARYEIKEYSGFELNMETIRDRAWLQQTALREELLSYHRQNLSDIDNIENIANYGNACDTSTPDGIDTCLELVEDNLAAPSNTWRGKQEWNGRLFLSPELSLVSRGSLVSDHRYVEDLYLPEDYVAAFSTRAQANAFSTAKARLNYNHSDFFLGLGTSYGDNVLLENQFKGFQIPAHFKLNTRLFSINPQQYLGIPIYVDLEAESFLIDDNQGSLTNQDRDLETLGNGTWQRANLGLISPIVREGIVRVDHFSDLELRRITHEGLEQDSSTIESWRSGLTVNLPIDGMGPLPSIFQNDDEQTKYLHHIMNWSMTYSARPVVTRRGLYGSEDTNGTPLVYFASDRDFLTTDGRDVSSEDTMIPHQRVTLATTHRWKTFDRGWQVIPGKIPEVEENKEKIESLHEQAKRELLFSLDRRIGKDERIFKENDDGSIDWYINRYKLQDSNSIEPVNFSASMTFDFEQERLRQDQIQENKDLEQQASVASDELAEELRAQKVPYYSLPESWSGPYFSLGLNWAGYNLTTSVNYNIYKRTSTSTRFDLSLPPFWKTSLGLSYIFEKSPELEPTTGDLLFKQTKTTTMGISTGLIPYISTGINLVQRQVEGNDSQYGTSVNLSYTDDSGCWGLRFVREKDLNVDEANANYILQLSVIFLGNSRSGDLSPALEREIPRFTFTR
ncbi:hypothetical protein SAMN06296036_107170 [Pseudobacteriovorax antillogorgiicola]|uniref:LPS-assembly protein LptD central domain-containing protein n=1 Tax=Pseudobacteriovorax antillogorgiicola TaxID=1513793 RepID=A0A1Y6BP90_9BACT|nr:hypothetical protein EDD56_107102 [Pseudobacteriovorax antillogorgiicola]SMF22189.1 hypothetical protein SAMN06296036_107170 [Pseudobacteriovorax antillogorgiicola]